MANTYEFTKSDKSMVFRSDGAFVPWFAGLNCPVDGGLAMRTWQSDGSPAPAAYNPAKWPP